jgi:hypothetical protein
MAPDEVATKMIFQEPYITLCQYISSRANGFTKVAEDPLNLKIYKNRNVGSRFGQEGITSPRTASGAEYSRQWVESRHASFP